MVKIRLSTVICILQITLLSLLRYINTINQLVSRDRNSTKLLEISKKSAIETKEIFAANYLFLSRVSIYSVLQVSSINRNNDTLLKSEDSV